MKKILFVLLLFCSMLSCDSFSKKDFTVYNDTDAQIMISFSYTYGDDDGSRLYQSEVGFVESINSKSFDLLGKNQSTISIAAYYKTYSNNYWISAGDSVHMATTDFK